MKGKRKVVIGPVIVLLASSGVAALHCHAACAGEWEYAGVDYLGSLITHEDATSEHPMRHEYRQWGDSFGVGEDSTSPFYVLGGAGYSESKGKVRWKYRWKRGMIYQYDPNTGTTQSLPDPNDNPPEKLWLWIFAHAHAYAFSGADGAWPRHPEMESAKANVDIESDPPDSLHVEGGDDVSDDTYRTEARAKLNRIVAVHTNGQEEVWGPWGVFDARGDVEGNRGHYYNSYGGYRPGYIEVKGEVFSSVHYGAPLINFHLIEPNPAGEPLLGENEYTTNIP